MSRQRNRRYVFTINNPTDRCSAAVDSVECRYIVVGVEKGVKGTLHLQGYIELLSAMSMQTVEVLLGGRAHLQIARGTAEQNKVYCSKEGAVTERGEPAAPGKRNDLEEVKAVCLATGRMRDVVQVAANFQGIKYAESILKYLGPMRMEPPVCKWYWGASGTGKTRAAVEEAGEDHWMSSRGLKWWDGYDGHTSVIIDDFRGDFCTFHELLRILDRYPFRVEVKGGSRMLLATKIWITSPHAPGRAYPNCAEQLEQLLRRIHVVREFNSVPAVQRSGVIIDPDLLTGEDDQKEAV